MVSSLAKTGVPDVKVNRKGMAKGSTTEEYLGNITSSSYCSSFHIFIFQCYIFKLMLENVYFNLNVFIEGGGSYAVSEFY